MRIKNGEQSSGWRFTGPNGEFILEEPQRVRDLYFPLANEAGMMSSITPLLHGDIKTSQHSFLIPPVSSEDLHLSRASRNFWVYLDGFGAWSATGQSARQISQNYQESGETVTMEGGFLWSRITRVAPQAGVKAEILNLVPADNSTVELMRVRISNLRNDPMTLVPTVAIPLYGRSADNLRDHRHVTSLLNRIYTSTYGVELQPTFCFDERGHKLNQTVYSILGAALDGSGPAGFFPVMADFIGEGGTLDWPEAVVQNLPPPFQAGVPLEGDEAFGGLRFQEALLAPGASQSYIIVMAIKQELGTEALAARYGSGSAFEEAWEQNKTFWNRKLNRLSFETGNPHFNSWIKWVTLQPILRRIYGCSFLPHHDYGKGGRGWRDLWQDCLALLLLEPVEVEPLLYRNFAGIRIDGSNATIIGNQPGEFLADRNNIVRVWMDHGAWPFFTTRLYLDQSGDLEFLLKEQSYFKDHRVFRARDLDPDWTPADGNALRQADGASYQGSILEHLLVELITPFYNVGAHNLMKLEDADWNDGLDMAGHNGESVAFTAFYAWNLNELSRLLSDLQVHRGITEVELAAELLPLFDTFQDGIDYDSVPAKQDLLQRYFETVKHQISGKKVRVNLTALAGDLQQKADWIGAWIHSHEWLTNSEGFQWFNGYYDDDGRRVEGDFPAAPGRDGVRMTLTGQVFPIMSGIASEEQVVQIIQAVDHYLKDPVWGGYRLNTDFGGIQPKLGRAFAFAYGHKENGAIFSHMAVMYSYALYHRGFVREGYRILKSLYDLAADFQNSRIYPGLPEYFNSRGRGMYHYLTGSASWYLMTLLTEVYGVRGFRGDLLLAPKLLGEQFNEVGMAKVTTVFAGRQLEIRYQNMGGLEFDQYRVDKIYLDNQEINYQKQEQGALIPRGIIENLGSNTKHRLFIILK